MAKPVWYEDFLTWFFNKYHYYSNHEVPQLADSVHMDEDTLKQWYEHKLGTGATETDVQAFLAHNGDKTAFSGEFIKGAPTPVDPPPSNALKDAKAEIADLKNQIANLKGEIIALNTLIATYKAPPVVIVPEKPLPLPDGSVPGPSLGKGSK